MELYMTIERAHFTMMGAGEIKMKYDFVDMGRNEQSQHDTYEEAFACLKRTTSVDAQVEEIPETPLEFIELAVRNGHEVTIGGDFDDDRGYHQVGSYYLDGATAEEIWADAQKFCRSISVPYYVCLEANGKRYEL